jgi:hypothetical protein
MIRSIVLYFIFGGILYALKLAPFSFKEKKKQRIVVSKEKVLELKERALTKEGTLDRVLYEALLEEEINDEALYREAFHLKLNKTDTTVRAWMVKNMKFLLEGSSSLKFDNDDDYFKKALMLGLDKEDLVVRRILVQRMKALLPLRGGLKKPTTEDLEKIRSKHFEKFSSPLLIHFSHFFVKKIEGQRSKKRIKSVIQKINKNPLNLKQILKEESDPFHLHPTLTLSKNEIIKSFGREFLKKLLPFSQKKDWIGPVASIFGHHFVKVHRILPRRLYKMKGIQDKLTAFILEEEKKSIRQKELAKLRTKYAVVIEGGES